MRPFLLAAVISLSVVAMSVPALAAPNMLANPRFEDIDSNGAVGDSWGSYGNAEFDNLFGRPSASLFADTGGNSGGFFQAGIVGSPGATYQFDLLDVRIEPQFSAKLYLGLEYYAGDDTTKLGETIVLVNTSLRQANGQVDGNVISMKGTALPGTVYVRPIVRFDSVNSTYAGVAQANVFVFDTYLSVAAAAGQEFLKNPGFEDVTGGGLPGYHWGTWGNAEINELFGPDNAHASLYCDQVGNLGGIYQTSILGTPGQGYRFALTNVRIEDNFAADLYFGLEYYAEDNNTKLGETMRQISATPGDGLHFEMVGAAVAGTVYVRSVIRFDNVTAGGESSNVFIFDASLTEAMLVNPRFEDLDLDSTLGDYWGKWGNVDFNNFFGRPHASLFADTAGNYGGFWQGDIPGAAGVTYQFDLLDVRIEANWSASLYFGMEFYAADGTTKMGESMVPIDTAARLAAGQTDSNVVSMQATAVAGTAFIRPLVYFENVNASYAQQSQANVFIFDTLLTVAPSPGRQYLKNAGFEAVNGSGNPGYYWGKWGAVDFNNFWGDNVHASFWTDNVANVGGVYQASILGTPGHRYRFALLDVRIEANFDGAFYYGLEYYATDNATKLGQTISQVPVGVTGDRRSFQVTGTAVAGTAYVRPTIFYNNVLTSGGSQRNVFVFSTDLTEAAAPGDLNNDNHVDDADLTLFMECATGPAIPYNPADPPAGCTLVPDVLGQITADINADGAVDMKDYAILQRCRSGTQLANVNCAD